MEHKSARAEKVTRLTLTTATGQTWTVEAINGGILITAPAGYVIDPLALTLPTKESLEVKARPK